MAHAWGQVLCLDPPQQRLGGVEHKHQRLVVAQHRLDGLQMQLHLARVRGTESRERGREKSKGVTRENTTLNGIHSCKRISQISSLCGSCGKAVCFAFVLNKNDQQLKISANALFLLSFFFYPASIIEQLCTLRLFVIGRCACLCTHSADKPTKALRCVLP